MTDSPSDGSATDLSCYITADENSGGSDIGWGSCISGVGAGRAADASGEAGVWNRVDPGGGGSVDAAQSSNAAGQKRQRVVTELVDADRTPVVEMFALVSCGAEPDDDDDVEDSTARSGVDAQRPAARKNLMKAVEESVVEEKFFVARATTIELNEVALGTSTPVFDTATVETVTTKAQLLEDLDGKVEQVFVEPPPVLQDAGVVAAVAYCTADSFEHLCSATVHSASKVETSTTSVFEGRTDNEVAAGLLTRVPSAERRLLTTRRLSLEEIPVSESLVRHQEAAAQSSADAPVPMPRRKRPGGMSRLLSRKRSESQILPLVEYAEDLPPPRSPIAAGGSLESILSSVEPGFTTDDVTSGDGGHRAIVLPTITDAPVTVEHVCSADDVRFHHPLPPSSGTSRNVDELPSAMREPSVAVAGGAHVMLTSLDDDDDLATGPPGEVRFVPVSVQTVSCSTVVHNEDVASAATIPPSGSRHAQKSEGRRKTHHINVDSIRRSFNKISSLGKEHGSKEKLDNRSNSRDDSPVQSKRDDRTTTTPGGNTDIPDDLLIQRSVIVQRDEKGYGFTVSGDNPVFVQSVKENGAAAKAGVQCGDRIIKVNGTLVTSSNHLEVVKMIKSGPYVGLTLLGRPASTGVPACTPKHLESAVVDNSPTSGAASGPLTGNPVLDRERISGPQAVDHVKDLEYRAQKIATIRMMHRQVLDEYEKMKAEYENNPTEQVQMRLEVKQQMLRRVESQLRNATAEVQKSSRFSEDESGSDFGDATPNQSITTPLTSGIPRHRRTESMPESSLRKPDDMTASRDRHSSAFVDGMSGNLAEEYETEMMLGTVDGMDGNGCERKLSAPNIQASTAWTDLRVEGVQSQPDSCLESMNTDHSDVTGQSSTRDSSSGQLSWKSALRRPRLKVVLPNQVRVMTMEESDFSTPVSVMPNAKPQYSHETPPPSIHSSNSVSSCSQQLNVLCMEDDEFSSDGEHRPSPPVVARRHRKLNLHFAKSITEVVTPTWAQVDEPGVFSDLSQLKHRPAHLAVFLHYLLSNSDPSPLLFYLITESYPLGSVKEMRKWAYEIHSTFLCETSPLRLLVDEATVSAIDSTLQFRNDKEEVMKSVFHMARNHAQNEICDLLSDFRMKRSLGLGSIYGDHELKDNMDRQSELKIVDSALWKHFERLVQDESSDRSQATASALATFFRQVGYSGVKNSSLLERCPGFNAKDRKVFRFSKSNKKMHAIKGHQFQVQQYYTATLCHCCQGVMWGIGSQGYQCPNCELNVHKNCFDRVNEPCVSSGSVRKKDRPRPPSMFEKIISRKPSTNNPAAIKEAQNLHDEQQSLASPTMVVTVPCGVPEEQEDDSSERKLRGGSGGAGRLGAGVPRALSMPSVHDATKPPKTSASSHGLAAKLQSPNGVHDTETPLSTVPTRVGKLVARYSELGKSLVSPLDDVKVTAPPPTRGDSPERDVSATSIDRDELTESSLSPISIGRSESLNHKGETRASVRRAHSDVHADDSGHHTVVTSGSSSNSSLSASCDSAASTSNEGLTDLPSHRSSFTVSTPAAIPNKSVHLYLLNDPDFDTEAELPSLDMVIPKEMLRKLKPKEKKRQEVINELFYTERNHVRNMKVMQRIFYQPMRDETWISPDVVQLLFPNIDEVVEVHSALNKEFQAKREENPVVGDFAEILVRKFSLTEGERFTAALSKFCQNQSHALEMLRLKQRKDQKFVAFLQEASSHPQCRRLELKDLIPMTMQRLTKYPLLIENLLKYTQSTTNEYDLLLRAHECSKNILNEVNRAVQECENHQRLVELQRRLDRRPIENSTHPVIAEYKKLDLTQHRMLYEGALTWRISRAKQIDLHVVLLEEILLLLQRQDEKLVLRCQSTTVITGKEETKFMHSPIIKLTNLLTRNVATDKRAFFLVSTSVVGPQIYELVAGSKDEKNKWFKHITDAAETYKVKDGSRNRKQSSNQPQPSTDSSDMHSVFDSAGTPTTDNSSRITASFDRETSDDAETHNKSGGSVESLDAIGQGLEVLHIEPSRLVQPNEVVVSSMVCIEKLEPVASPIEQLREKTDLIERTMGEKKLLVAEILQIPVQDYDSISEVVEEVRDSSDVRELLLGSVTQADKLTRLINNQLSVDNVVRQQSEASEQKPEPTMDAGSLPIVVSGTQLMSICSHLHRHLGRLLDVMVAKTQELSQLQTELNAVHGQLDAMQAAASTEELRSRSNSRSQSSRPHSFLSAGSSESNDGQEQFIDVSVEPDHVLATASLMTVVPVMMERLEIIESQSTVQPVFVDPVQVIVVPGGSSETDDDAEPVDQTTS